MASTTWSIWTIFYIVIVILVNAKQCKKGTIPKGEKCHLCMKETASGSRDPCKSFKPQKGWICEGYLWNTRRDGTAPTCTKTTEIAVPCLCTGKVVSTKGKSKAKRKKATPPKPGKVAPTKGKSKTKRKKATPPKPFGKVKRKTSPESKSPMSPEAKSVGILRKGLKYHTIYIVVAHGFYVGATAESQIVWTFTFPVHLYQRAGCKLDDDRGIKLQQEYLEVNYEKAQKAADKLALNTIHEGNKIEDYVFGSDAGMEHMAGVYKIKYSSEKKGEIISEQIIHQIYGGEWGEITKKSPVKLTDLAESIKKDPGDIFWLACSVYMEGEREFTPIASIPSGPQNWDDIETERMQRELQCEETLSEVWTEAESHYNDWKSILGQYYATATRQAAYATGLPEVNEAYEKTRSELDRTYDQQQEEARKVQREGDESLLNVCMTKHEMKKALKQNKLFEVIRVAGFSDEGYTRPTGAKSQYKNVYDLYGDYDDDAAAYYEEYDDDEYYEEYNDDSYDDDNSDEAAKTAATAGNNNAKKEYQSVYNAYHDDDYNGDYDGDYNEELEGILDRMYLKGYKNGVKAGKMAEKKAGKRLRRKYNIM